MANELFFCPTCFEDLEVVDFTFPDPMGLCRSVIVKIVCEKCFLTFQGSLSFEVKRGKGFTDVRAARYYTRQTMEDCRERMRQLGKRYPDLVEPGDPKAPKTS